MAPPGFTLGDKPEASIRASDDVLVWCSAFGVSNVRTTINLDDTLLSEAERVSGIKERTALVNEGIRALIERESAKRLARLGGSQPTLKPIHRRRSESV